MKERGTYGVPRWLLGWIPMLSFQLHSTPLAGRGAVSTFACAESTLDRDAAKRTWPAQSMSVQEQQRRALTLRWYEGSEPMAVTDDSNLQRFYIGHAYIVMTAAVPALATGR